MEEDEGNKEDEDEEDEEDKDKSMNLLSESSPWPSRKARPWSARFDACFHMPIPIPIW
jgi:hypothetical protein